MGGPCKGRCEGSGGLPAEVRVVHYHGVGGRPPADPATGKRPPAGSYGSWRRCRQCAIYLTWAGKYCPCCGTPVQHKTGASKAHRHRVRQAMKEAAAAAAAAKITGGGGGAVPLVPLVVPDKRRRVA